MDTTKHWCNDCGHLHRVPVHLEQHAVCCVACGGSLRTSPTPAKKRARKAPRAARQPDPEPQLETSSTSSAWLRRAAPYMVTALLTACAALFKIAAGRPVLALVSAMLCLLACLRVALIYEEESQEEDELSYAPA